MPDYSSLTSIATEQGKNIASNNGISFSGAASGAAIGGAVGSVVPVVGNIVGGAIGGAAGFLSDNADYFGKLLGIGSGGGNRNDGKTKWVRFDAFFKGEPKFGQVPQLENSNPNWNKTYYNDISKEWGSKTEWNKYNLDQWNSIFITVLSDNPYFYNNIKGDWITPLIVKYNQLIKQKTNNIMPSNTTSFTATTGGAGVLNSIDWGKLGKDILIGGTTAGVSSANDQLKDNPTAKAAKEKLVESASNSAIEVITNTLKKFWYVPVIIVVAIVSIVKLTKKKSKY